MRGATPPSWGAGVSSIFLSGFFLRHTCFFAYSRVLTTCSQWSHETLSLVNGDDDDDDDETGDDDDDDDETGDDDDDDDETVDDDDDDDETVDDDDYDDETGDDDDDTDDGNDDKANPLTETLSAAQLYKVLHPWSCPGGDKI